jgi:hypothetical protein
MSDPQIKAVEEAVNSADIAVVRAMSYFNRWMTWTATVKGDQFMKRIDWQNKQKSMDFLSNVAQWISTGLQLMGSVQSTIETVVRLTEVKGDEYQAGWIRVRQSAQETSVFWQRGLLAWKELDEAIKKAVGEWKGVLERKDFVKSERMNRDWSLKTAKKQYDAHHVDQRMRKYVDKMKAKITDIENMTNRFSGIASAKRWSLVDGVYGFTRVKVAFFDLVEVRQSIPHSSIQEMINTADKAIIDAIVFFRKWLDYKNSIKISWQAKEDSLKSLEKVKAFSLNWDRAMFLAQHAIHDIIKEIDKETDALLSTAKDEEKVCRSWANIKLLAKITGNLWDDSLSDIKALAAVIKRIETKWKRIVQALSKPQVEDDMEMLPMSNDCPIDEITNEMDGPATKMTREAEYRPTHLMDGGIYGFAQLRAELARLEAKELTEQVPE